MSQPPRAIDDVRSQFAGVPLFDASLNEELLALERRQQSQRLQVASRDGDPVPPAAFPRNRFYPIGGIDPTGVRSRSPMSVDLSATSSPSIDNRQFQRGGDGGGSAATFALPPKIMRPWSVEVLMRRGDALHTTLRHSQFNHNTQSTPLQQRIATRKSNHGGGGRGASVGRSRGKHVHGQRYGNSPNAADSSEHDDDAYHSGPRDPEAGDFRRRHHHEDVFLHEDQPLSSAAQDAAQDLMLGLDDVVLSEQIERAATRKRLQEERLRKLGLNPPGTLVSEGEQTERHVTRFEPDSHGVPQRKVDDFNVSDLLARITGAAGAHASSSLRSVDAGTSSSPQQQRAASPHKQHHPPRTPQHHREADAASSSRVRAPLVLDAVGYKPYAAPTEASAADTIWRRMLVEEMNPQNKRAPGQPSAYQLAHQSSSAMPTSATSASAAPTAVQPGAALYAPRELGVSHDPSQVLSTQVGLDATNPFETKEQIMRQLDRMQLANEEMLVRNKIASTTPSAAGGYDRHQLETHRALGHVAEARKSAAGPVLPPSGGYGSVTDRSADGGAQWQSEGDRWGAAHIGHQLESGSGQNGRQSDTTTPLRRWAADHSNQVPSTAHRSTLPHAKQASAHSAQQLASNFVYAPTPGAVGYDARKKWSGVSFGAAGDSPDHRHHHAAGRGYQHHRGSSTTNLEALSNAATDWMHPDPAPYGSTPYLQ